MSFCNQDTLKAFVGADNYLTEENDPEGLKEAIAQADDIITARTGIAVPEAPDQARALLRNIAARLVLYFTGGQSKLSEEAIEQRRRWYNEAIADLLAIQSGSFKVAAQEKPELFIKSRDIRVDGLT